MKDTAARCHHAIDIDDGACAARPEATLGRGGRGVLSPASMDDRTTNNYQIAGDDVFV